MRKAKHNNNLVKDLGIVALSVIVAVVLVRTHALAGLFTASQQLEYLGSFIVGMFFTSAFTTAPAIVTLGELARHDGVFAVAFFGALGAVIGDLVIFHFVRDRIPEDMMELVRKERGLKRILTIFKMRALRPFALLAGGLIIASPLPDELGITLLGFSKIPTRYFVVVSFIFNFLGIVLIGLLAKSVA